MDKSIDNISKHLIENYNAVEITINEFINKSRCILEDIPENTVKVFKITDKSMIESLLSESEKEEILITIEHLSKNNLSEDTGYDVCIDYMNQISTGDLIIVTLESEDNINLSGFTMQGSGEKLYNYLLGFIGEKLEKNPNPLDETIYELNQFRPYGKYFK